MVQILWPQNPSPDLTKQARLPLVQSFRARISFEPRMIGIEPITRRAMPKTTKGSLIALKSQASFNMSRVQEIFALSEPRGSTLNSQASDFSRLGEKAWIS